LLTLYHREMWKGSCRGILFLDFLSGKVSVSPPTGSSRQLLCWEIRRPFARPVSSRVGGWKRFGQRVLVLKSEKYDWKGRKNSRKAGQESETKAMPY